MQDLDWFSVGQAIEQRAAREAAMLYTAHPEYKEDFVTSISRQAYEEMTTNFLMLTQMRNVVRFELAPYPANESEALDRAMRFDHVEQRKSRWHAAETLDRIIAEYEESTHVPRRALSEKGSAAVAHLQDIDVFNYLGLISALELQEYVVGGADFARLEPVPGVLVEDTY